jgi:biotin transport system substrate-specific component
MLRHMNIETTRTQSEVYRFVGIAVLVVLMIASARVTIEIGNLVPFTLQVLVVLLAGLVLGARDGALSMMSYVGFIAMGAPLDARSLGSAALFGPTGGYLIGFIFAAGAVGLLIELYEKHFRTPQSEIKAGAKTVTWAVWARQWAWRYLACMAGIAIIYLFGIRVLQLQANLNLSMAWDIGGKPFWWVDLCKAAIAVSLAEWGRAAFLRFRQFPLA